MWIATAPLASARADDSSSTGGQAATTLRVLDHKRPAEQPKGENARAGSLQLISGSGESGGTEPAEVWIDSSQAASHEPAASSEEVWISSDEPSAIPNLALVPPKPLEAKPDVKPVPEAPLPPEPQPTAAPTLTRLAPPPSPWAPSAEAKAAIGQVTAAPPAEPKTPVQPEVKAPTVESPRPAVSFAPTVSLAPASSLAPTKPITPPSQRIATSTPVVAPSQPTLTSAIVMPKAVEPTVEPAAEAPVEPMAPVSRSLIAMPRDKETFGDWSMPRQDPVVSPAMPRLAALQPTPAPTRAPTPAPAKVTPPKVVAPKVAAPTPAPGKSSAPAPKVVEAPLPAPAPKAPPTAAPFVTPALPARAPLAPQGPLVSEAGVVRPFEVIEESGEMTVMLRRSKLLRTKVDVYRTAVVDPSVCDIVQFTPREVSVIGRGQGATHITFWFDDASFRPITYLVRVVPDPEVQKRREEQYGLMVERLAELFPNSKVELVPIADKLIVRGQARDAAEAAQIMAIIRGEVIHQRGLVEGRAADPMVAEETGRPLPPAQVINMLRIPGVQQVALRVKIAELNRSAARNFGVDLDLSFADGKLLVQSLLNAASGSTATVIGNFDGGDIQFGINYLEKHGVMRMLSEPTLVTLSGRPATFIAGGEFAVPTTVGVQGAAAITTDFRAYGAIITFLPVVIDKDHIRLEVAPEFSKLNTDLNVNGTPGLNTRAVTTTVEMREGQTLAIAGLLDESMKGDNEGNLPLVAQIFGKRGMTRNETELIILVTPELVQPMEPEEVPPLPGFDVTEPTNAQFYLGGKIEGRPTQEYRSTVWPRLRHRYQSGGPAMISGPFGHGD